MRQLGASPPAQVDERSIIGFRKLAGSASKKGHATGDRGLYAFGDRRSVSSFGELDLFVDVVSELGEARQ